jgi:hypothetical protein
MIQESDTVVWDHENNELFKQAHDEQLLLWLHRSVYLIKYQMCLQRQRINAKQNNYVCCSVFVATLILVIKAELLAFALLFGPQCHFVANR